MTGGKNGALRMVQTSTNKHEVSVGSMNEHRRVPTSVGGTNEHKGSMGSSNKHRGYKWSTREGTNEHEGSVGGLIEHRRV